MMSSLFSSTFFHDRVTTITLRSSLSDFSNSSYGNSDLPSGVIDLGDEGGVIGDVVVSFLIDFGRPQTSDSIELTNSSFGLLGSHICAFISGDMVVVPTELGGEGGGGGGGAKGIKGDMNSACCPSS
jgi:hypothetical protein